MITQINVLDMLSTILAQFSMSGDTPYSIEDFSGTEPVTATVNTVAYASSEGEALQSTRIGKRNIVITLGYKPSYETDQTIESLREALYESLAPQTPVTLMFLDNNKDPKKIDGVIESLTPVLFSKDPQIQISIICPDPYFRSMQSVILAGMDTTPLQLSYPGNAKVGFLLTITAPHALTTLTVRDFSDPDLVFTSPLATGDKLMISTVKNAKSLTVLRSGATTPVSILAGIAAGSLAMTIGKKTTGFELFADATGTVNYSLEYLPKFVGV